MIHRSYNGAELHELLAHRFPMLLIDRIDVVDPGRRVVGTKLLSASEWWADANNVAFPFSLVIEALAQTSAGLIDGLNEGTGTTVAYFMAANRIRFRAEARVGDLLTLDIALQQWRRGVCRTRGVVRVDAGRLVATAELTTIVRYVG